MPIDVVGAPDHALSRALRPRHVFISRSAASSARPVRWQQRGHQRRRPAVIISYMLTGLMIFLIMRMLGEMPWECQSALIHGVCAGRPRQLAGFTVGWLYWYFWVIVVPVEAIAGATILQHWFPLPNWEIGGALMVLMTAVNLLSARSFGEFEFWFSSIKVSAIIAFILLAASYPSADFRHWPDGV